MAHDSDGRSCQIDNSGRVVRGIAFCNFSKCSSTSVTETSETSSDVDCSNWYGTPHGCHLRASESPKKHSTGFPSAAATCIAPPSLQITCSQTASPAKRADSVGVGNPTMEMLSSCCKICLAFASSPGWVGL